MKRFTSFSKVTRILIIATIALFLYGYLCRLFGFYFFGESKIFGWMLFWFAIIVILIDRVKQKKLQQRSRSFEKIGIGFAVFLILVKAILFLVTQQSAAYETALNFIKSAPSIQNKVGSVNDIFLIPFGGISMKSSSEGTAGPG